MRRVWAIARCRCPRCLSGRVWRGMFTMNEPCPVCGMRFERETGYWTGAMVASYALGIPVLALLVLAVWLGTGWDIVLALVVADVLFLAVVPFVWQTWWFRFGSACGAGLMFFGVHRFRLGRYREIERLRLRLAADLHDDVGSNLSTISLLSRRANPQRHRPA